MGDTRRCYRCGEPGHLQFKCKKKLNECLQNWEQSWMRVLIDSGVLGRSMESTGIESDLVRRRLVVCLTASARRVLRTGVVRGLKSSPRENIGYKSCDSGTPSSSRGISMAPVSIVSVSTGVLPFEEFYCFTQVFTLYISYLVIKA